MVTDDARSASTWNREKGLPLTELERAIQLTTNWTVIVVMLSTCCPVRFVMRSTLGQQQQNLGLGLTIIRPVLERIQGFLLRVETRMIFYIDIFLARDTMVFRHPTDEQLRHVDIYFLATKIICSLSTLKCQYTVN